MRCQDSENRHSSTDSRKTCGNGEIRRALPGRVSGGFLVEMFGLAPLTEANTARILAASPFNIHSFLRNAPVVNSLDVMKQAAAHVGKQVTNINFNAAHTRYIAVQASRYLADCFNADNLTKAARLAGWRVSDCKGCTICIT